MYIVKAEENQVKTIVDMSVRAFETDVNVGGAKGDCPPGYDSVEWHKQMAREGHLYQAMIGKDIVGAPASSNSNLLAFAFYDDTAGMTTTITTMPMRRHCLISATAMVLTRRM